MKGGKTIAFILPFDRTMASIHVRAKCLMDYAPEGWKFQFVEGGAYPRVFDFPVARMIYRFLFYLISLIAIKFKNRNFVSIIIKPNSIFLILTIRYILRIKIISDINDPVHLPPYGSRLKTLLILKFSNRIIFESQEYRKFWGEDKIASSSIIEDTPQHECIYLDYLIRVKQVIWVGSPAMSGVLLDFIPHLLLFNKSGFEVKLLGASASVVQILLNSGVRLFSLYEYDNVTLTKELATSAISFVPMPNSELYNLRGNLKAKISMACGCLTIASKNEMHERLIENQKTGFLFNSYADLRVMVEFISKEYFLCKSIAFNGNLYIANNFTRTDHARKICEIADGIY